MPQKRKTKEVRQTDRESIKEATEATTEPVSIDSIAIQLTPVQMQQINVLAQIAHNEDPAVYCRKIILKHVADRLYLVRQ